MVGGAEAEGGDERALVEGEHSESGLETAVVELADEVALKGGDGDGVGLGFAAGEENGDGGEFALAQIFAGLTGPADAGLLGDSEGGDGGGFGGGAPSDAHPAAGQDQFELVGRSPEPGGEECDEVGGAADLLEEGVFVFLEGSDFAVGGDVGDVEGRGHPFMIREDMPHRRRQGW